MAPKAKTSSEAKIKAECAVCPDNTGYWRYPGNWGGILPSTAETPANVCKDLCATNYFRETAVSGSTPAVCTSCGDKLTELWHENATGNAQTLEADCFDACAAGGASQPDYTGECVCVGPRREKCGTNHNTCSAAGICIKM